MEIFELQIDTIYGKGTAVIEVHAINCYQDDYTAWLKEKPTVIVGATSVNQAIIELQKSLEVMADNKKIRDSSDPPF